LGIAGLKKTLTGSRQSDSGTFKSKNRLAIGGKNSKNSFKPLEIRGFVVLRCQKSKNLLLYIPP
jgi:hypothetical protein